MTPDKTPADRLAEAIEASNLDLALAHSVFRKALEAVDDKSGRDLVELMKRRILANDKALHDYRASKVEDDELVERLRELRSECAKATGIMGNGDVWHEETLDAAITRLQSQSDNPWVKIDNPIVETWKDADGPSEGYVDIANKAGGRFPNATYEIEHETHGGRYTGQTRGFWQSASGHEVSEPAFAMLPIAPPKTEG